MNNPVRYTDPTGYTTRCREIGGVNFCAGGTVANRSSHDIAVIGDIPLRDAQGNVVRDSNGEIVYQEDVKIILHPGESSFETYDMVDADFIQPYGTSIDGHNSTEVFKLLDLTAIAVFDDPLNGGLFIVEIGIGWLFEAARNGIKADIGGWRPASGINIPRCALNEPNDPSCTNMA